MKKDAFYFSHDANAQSDPKVLRLLRKHDWYGYGLFWAIVEMLRNEPTYKLDADYETYAFALRTDAERIKSIVEDFDLFTVEDGFFFSESLMRRMAMKNEKSEKARKSALARWGKKETESELYANALRPDSESNAKKEKEKKEKEIKEKKETTTFSVISFRPDWIPEQDWTDIVSHRRKHKSKPPETERAYKGIIDQIQIAQSSGYSLAQCLDKWLNNSSWQTFKAEYMEGFNKSALIQGQPQKTKRQLEALRLLETI